MFVSSILAAKGGNVAMVPSRTTVALAAHRMRLQKCGALLVTDDGGRTIAGIISERDITRALPEHGAELGELQVSELMSRKVITCRPDDNVRSVMRTMTTRRFRHMPVVGEDGSLIGIVSIGDVVKHHIDELELETNVLRDVAAVHH